MDKEAIGRTFMPAAHAALTSFPIEAAELTLVSLAENVTFKAVDGRDGRAYVLRLHRPGYHTLDELISERAWIRALAEAGIDVPSAVLARDGRDYVAVTIPATGECASSPIGSGRHGHPSPFPVPARMRPLRRATPRPCRPKHR